MRLGGEFSYSIYLLHPFVIGLATTRLAAPVEHLLPDAGPRFGAMLAIAVAATVAVAALTFFAIEAPARKAIRARFGIRRQWAGSDASAVAGT